ncbi:MAG TPA: ADOP family duplicated permease [Vicinamibacterales bacterium]|nr:ADOP family duplicated permease [Vicinamibacterales bacterium]
MGIRSWLQRRRLDDDDFEEEIRAHLAIAMQERVADGEDRESARYAALREFGNVTLTTEAARRVWTPRWLEALRDLTSDVRYAVRALRKNPVFAATVIGVLTLGIGLNAAAFTMLKSFTLSPLAGVAGSSRIAVVVGETNTGRPARLSYPDYLALRDHDRAFTGLFGSTVAAVNLGRGRGARLVWGEIVTGNYFHVLGVRAQHGRLLLPSDEVAPGRHPVVVLSDGIWRRDFAASPDVIGKTLEINNTPLTVVGVADRAFHGTIVSYDVELFIPLMMAPDLGFTFGSQQTTPSGILADRTAAVFYPQGFLRPGITRTAAAASADALWNSLRAGRPLMQGPQRLEVVPFRESPSSAPTFILPTLGVLSVMGLCVLIIACANIAGLVLVRGLSRRGEIAVRLALGASRTRIVRLLLVENLVLALPGALFGVLLARQSVPVLVGYAEWLARPQRIFFNVELDAVVIAFAAVAACGSALLFGFIPALQSSRVDLVTVINEDASPRGAARGRLRAGLVVAQVAVSLLLLVCAGLSSRSGAAARSADPGFDARQVTALDLDLRQNGYDRARGRVFYRALLEALRSDPSIESATLAAYHPLALLDTRTQRVTIEGYEPRRDEDLSFMWNIVAPGYFRTLRVPLQAGRDFGDDDDDASAPVVIVNNTLAHRFWGSASKALGQRLRTVDGKWRTVVGVASDLKYSRINEAPRPYFYVPFLESYRSAMILHTRGTAPPERLVEQARGHIAALDGELPVLSARPLVETTRGALIFFDLAATMLFIFGAAGMALAALGTYGLVSYTVRQSTHEIGIRMALGASALSVVRQFVARGLRLGAAGAALGLAAALGASSLLRTVLFGVSTTDLVSFARALVIVCAVVFVATLIPAWRAAQTKPLSALRHQ